MATNNELNTSSTAYNIHTSQPTVEDSILVMNDTKAEQHSKNNAFNTNVSLITALEKQNIKGINTTEHAVVCTLSGYATFISLPAFVDDSTLLNFSMPLSVFTNIAKQKDTVLYTLPVALLSATITALYHNIDMVRSVNPSRGMDSMMLSTVGIYHLVQAIKLYRVIKTNAIDVDTLPKLDISYETHNNGIYTMEQPLTNYLTLLENELQSAIHYIANKAIEDRARKLQLEALALEKRNSKQNKQVETQYEEKRRLAVKALKEASIDLVYMNYKKLTSVLTTAVATKNGAELMSKEVKNKILERLDEVLTKSKDSSFNNEINTIKAFIILANSDKVESRKDSALERASDFIPNKTAPTTLRNKLLAMQAKKGTA